MRILICSDVYPALRGIAQCTKGISEVLKKKHRVVILASIFGHKKREEIVRGIKVNRIEYSKVEDFMKQNRDFDLVIVQWLNYLLPAIKYFKKVVYIMPSVRGVSLKFRMQDGKVENIKKIKGISKIEKEGLEKVWKIIYPSKNIKKQVEKEYGIKKGKIIPHGVDLEKFSPGKEKKYEVITIANFDPRKGVDKLINVAKFSKGKFIVLGEGKLGKEYKKLIKKLKLEKRIKLLGQKKPVGYLQKSKVYVLPSIYETFGLVLLEAMASGLPCIAFKPGKKILTASNEIIKKGMGFLVKDEKEMAEKIDLLLKNEKLRKKMGEKARKEVEKYSWDKYVEKLLDFTR